MNYHRETISPGRALKKNNARDSRSFDARDNKNSTSDASTNDVYSKQNNEIVANPSVSLNETDSSFNQHKHRSKIDNVLNEKDLALFYQMYKKMKRDHEQVFIHPQSRPDAQIFSNRSIGLFNSFNQGEVIDGLNLNEHKTLINIEEEFNGLCEIISNFVIMKDLLGQADDISISNKLCQIKNNVLKMDINLPNLNNDKVRHSHILKTSNIFVKLLAIIFEIYPYSIIPAFSNILLTEKRKQHNVNPVLLHSQLDDVEAGKYIKFMVFKRSGISFNGHSMLIKKLPADRYSFFDPNKGEYRDLTMSDLVRKINNAIHAYGGNRVAFIDGQKYVQELGVDINVERQVSCKL